MTGEYSEELVELVAMHIEHALRHWTPNEPRFVQAAWDATLEIDREDRREFARRILDALSSAGRLVPEGSEVHEQWGVQWLTGEAVYEYDDAEQAELFAEQAAPFRGEVMRRTTLTTPWTPAEPAQRTGVAAQEERTDG